MIFPSAGHSATPGKNYDPGATGVNGRTEAAETVRIRDKVISILKGRGMSVIHDADGESLGEYLKRIQTGAGSVVCEFHFNAFNGTATGAEVIVGADADKLDLACAKELAKATSDILTIPLRGKDGVITEADSHRGKLGLMRENGTVVLVEVCFIDNAKDMKSFDDNIDDLAEAYADILIKYEMMVV